jgi:hypothetical protein
MSRQDSYTLNDGHIVEAADRIDVARAYLAYSLRDHPLITAVPAFESKVEALMSILSELYQDVGIFEQIADVFATHRVKDGYKARKSETEDV